MQERILFVGYRRKFFAVIEYRDISKTFPLWKLLLFALSYDPSSSAWSWWSGLITNFLCSSPIHIRPRTTRILQQHCFAWNSPSNYLVCIILPLKMKPRVTRILQQQCSANSSPSPYVVGIMLLLNVKPGFTGNCNEAMLYCAIAWCCLSAPNPTKCWKNPRLLVRWK